MPISIGDLLLKIRASYWLKSGTLVLISKVSVMIFGFVSFLILIRYLDKEQFGVWVIFMTITSLVETIRIGFLKSPLMILNSDKSIDKKALYASSFYLNLISSTGFILSIFISLLIFNLFFDIEIFTSLFGLFFIKLLIISISDHSDLIQETNLEFKGSFQDLVARSGVFVILISVSYYLNYSIDLRTLVIFQIVGSIVGLVFSYVNARLKKIAILTSLKVNTKVLRKYFELGKYTFGTSLISITARNVDTWMLGVLISPAAVAIYNPALRLSNIFEIPSSTMSTILLPKLTRKIGKEGAQSVKYYYEKSLSYIMMFMIPVVICFYFFAEEIIHVVVGSGYDMSSELLKWTIFYGLLIPFNRQFTVVMDALGKPKTSFIVLVITLVLSLTLNYLFIDTYGIIGAAYASLLTYFIILLVTQFYLKQKLRINLWYILKGIIPVKNSN